MNSNQERLKENISLCDAIDRLLNKGVVVTGDITVSVAGVDLLYVGLRALVVAIDAMDEMPPSLTHGQRPRNTTGVAA
ncbi:gas vesicle protein [Pirellulaceae bacterium SH449]